MMLPWSKTHSNALMVAKRKEAALQSQTGGLSLPLSGWVLLDSRSHCATSPEAIKYIKGINEHLEKNNEINYSLSSH